MKNVKKEIAEILAAASGLSVEESEDLVEIPVDSAMGDYAFPCFKLAKTMRKAPAMIAADIAEAIGANPLFQKVENVNAYVNMFLARESFARDTISEVLARGDDFGRSNEGEGRTVIVEFSSPNIAKPFHIGHIRSTVIGNSINKIYDFLGYKVVRINHLGDYGTQFGKMIVAYKRWGKREEVEAEPIQSLLSYYIKFHEASEKDPSLEDEARATFTRLEQGNPEELELWSWFREESLREFGRVYDMLGVSFDSYTGESFFNDKMPAVIEELKEKGLLEESRGAQIVDLSDYGMTPALITKSDGSSLYITRDIAAAIYRKQTYDFVKCIYVVASQQNLHFQQWFKVVELMGYEWAKDCIHVPFGLISMEDGTMSTRHGRVVFLEDVLKKAVEKTREIVVEKQVNTDSIDETSMKVGIGAVIFNELANNRIKDYVFSWDKVLNFDGETGPYVQYTHARAASVIRNSGLDPASLSVDGAELGGIVSDSAYELVKLLYRFPEFVSEAGEKYEPSVVTRHIVDVAQAFNRFYHSERINVEDEEEQRAKLLLTMAAKQTIRNGLTLLGIEAPDKM
ncbi:MAG TPA: arginine--tRNA ligase [Bacillota bacterium]|nr:arginine--tRNA ligase [Bacillota bacterium]